jgi:hypothetical protein
MNQQQEDTPMEGSQDIATTEEKTPVLKMLSDAVAAGRDVATLEKLMDLNERVLDRNARNAYFADFVRMKPHLKKIENKHNNSQTNSRYAKLEDINKEIDPVLEQYGFATSTKIVKQTESGVTVRAELLHREGHREDTEIEMPLDKTGIAGKVKKTDPHALTSSVKYARRVAICALLNISTGDGADRDGNSGVKEPQPIPTEQAAPSTYARANSKRQAQAITAGSSLGPKSRAPIKFSMCIISSASTHYQQRKKKQR